MRLQSIVSEETGGISICHRRRIERNFTPETFRQRISEILLHGNYEETDPEKLASEVDIHPARDHGLVSDQEERSDDPSSSETGSNVRTDSVNHSLVVAARSILAVRRLMQEFRQIVFFPSAGATVTAKFSFAPVEFFGVNAPASAR